MNNRILGLDIGTKRIGVAISDTTHTIATGLGTIEKTTKKEVGLELKKIIENFGVDKIVIGMPLNISGGLSPQALSIKRDAEELKKEIEVEIIFWDERYTTVQSEKILASFRVSRKKRKKIIDKTSAILILQSYLDFLKVQNQNIK